MGGKDEVIEVEMECWQLCKLDLPRQRGIHNRFHPETQPTRSNQIPATAVDEFRQPWRIWSGMEGPSTGYVTATGVRELQHGLRRHFRALVGAPPRVAGTGYPLSLATTAAPDAQFTLSMTPRVGRGGDHLGM